MNIGEVKSLFRDYIDEADATFITDANVALYCKIGYDQFRSVVNGVDLSFYQADYEFSLVDGELDLEATAPTAEAGKFLLGDPANKPTKGQLANLVKIASVTAGNLIPASYYSAAQDREELTVLADSFVMEGSVLRFSREATDTIRIYYVPKATIDFTEVDATLIDNLTEFHDLIALYAYRSYAIRDGASNPQIEAQGSVRETAFRMYLERGRIIGAANHVGYVD